jgi:hypothetical protein
VQGFPEHNFGFRNISNSTVDTLQLWPDSVPITFVGWELAFDTWTGGQLTADTPTTNPCRRAYVDHQGPNTARESWDPVTTLVAVRGVEQHYIVHRGGHNRVNRTDGTNVWVAGAITNQGYLVPGAGFKNTSVAKEINEMLIRPPQTQVVKGQRLLPQ